MLTFRTNSDLSKEQFALLEDSTSKKEDIERGSKQKRAAQNQRYYNTMMFKNETFLSLNYLTIFTVATRSFYLD